MKQWILVAFSLLATANSDETLDNILEDSKSELDLQLVAPWRKLFESRELNLEDDDGNPVAIDPSETYSENVMETLNNLRDNVTFYLYTRETINNPEILKIGDIETLYNSHIHLANDTKFIIHGWFNSHKSQACSLIRDAFLQYDPCNVIVVDWSCISAKPYPFACSRIVMVSQHVSKMIDFLASQGLDRRQITNVGHSLGAHVAGLASYYSKKGVVYVVGLDPIQPLLKDLGEGERLSKGDADYVQVIHSNAGLLGFQSSIGDADFYPNGGVKQNGCKNFTCSHKRSYEYFAESINSEVGFVAKKCINYMAFRENVCRDETALMGGAEPNFQVKGEFFLDTNDREPFAKGLDSQETLNEIDNHMTKKLINLGALNAIR